MSTTAIETIEPVSMFKRPKAVYAVAFACIISFMGIGLVDPILPSLKEQLDASESQVTLLFTSYLLVTVVAMLGTNWVSSRIGAKPTLIAGLSIIVVFSALAGFSGSIDGIVGFRAGWGREQQVRADRCRDRCRHLHRHQQHPHHTGRDDGVCRRASSRLGVVRLRPLHRRRACTLRCCSPSPFSRARTRCSRTPTPASTRAGIRRTRTTIQPMWPVRSPTSSVALAERSTPRRLNLRTAGEGRT